MELKAIYEDKDVLVVDKPARIVVFPEGNTTEKTLVNHLIEKYPDLALAGQPPRFGIVHRLDKDTSGILLVAKTNEALIFFQKQFKNREVDKKYVCLAEGTIKDDQGEVKTLIARSPRDPRKQKAYLEQEPHPQSAREAITEYKVLDRFKDYALLEVQIKTGRRHQIRCHLSFLQHPIAGDKLYGFKNSKAPEGLTRQFLHAQYLKIKLPSGQTKEFTSNLPEELKNILDKLEKNHEQDIR
jgi:23S rRNA pseudouridine1911/1915/1917 synthase